MSIFGSYGERQKAGPFNPVGSLLRQGAARIIDSVIGGRLDETGVMRREVEEPLSKAHLAAQDVKKAQETGDEDLLQRAVAMGAQAVLFARDPPLEAYVPPDVSHAVLEIAETLPLGDVTDNPFISTADAQRLESLLQNGRTIPPQ